MENNLEMCGCGHEKELHYGIPHSPCQFEVDKIYCRCSSFRPAPSQPSMNQKEDVAFVSTIRAKMPDWWIKEHKDEGHKNGVCDECRPKKEKESTEVRDEKIARIVKEFREKDVACPFHGQDALKNKTGYYEVKCQTCDNSGFVRQNSKKFPVIKCPWCR